MCSLMTLENGNGSCWITNESLLFAKHNCLRLLVSDRWFGHLDIMDKELKDFREWKWVLVILF